MSLEFRVHFERYTLIDGMANIVSLRLALERTQARMQLQHDKLLSFDLAILHASIKVVRTK